MTSLWIPQKETDLIETIDRLKSSVFYSIFLDEKIEVNTWNVDFIRIQWNENDWIDFDIKQSKLHAGTLSSIPFEPHRHQIYYVEHISDAVCELKIPNTVYISTKHDVLKHRSDYWCDEKGEEKILFHRSERNNNFKIKNHLAWFILSLSFDFSFDDAIVLSRASTNVSCETWPRDMCCFPSVCDPNKQRQIPFLSIDRAKFSLYPIVDSSEWVHRLTVGFNIQTVQLRIKKPLLVNLEQQIQDVCNLTNRTGIQLFINDYWQLAIKYHAFGVHLGQSDLNVADTDKIHKANLRLGISTHGYYEILKAESLSPSYIALGHVFPTTTKNMTSQPQGLIRLTLYQELIDSIYNEGQKYPTVAIGGINLTNAKDVLATKVSSLAVVRAITQADDLKKNIQLFHSVFSEVKKGNR